MTNAKIVEINGRSRIRSLIFFQDGKYLLSGGDEAMIRQWRVHDGVEVGEGMKTGSTITSMDLTSDGNWIVSSGQRVANVWSTRSRQITVTVSEHSDWVDTVHVSPDSTRFATGSNDKRAFIWDISTGKRLVGPLEHKERVGVARFSPDGNRFLTSTANDGLRIYNARNGELLRKIPVLVVSYPSNLIAWSSSQTIFALVSRNTLMHIDINTGQTCSSQTIPGDPVEAFGLTLGSIALSSNGRFIASFVGRLLSLWDTSTSSRASSDIRCGANLWSMALSMDGKCLAVSDANNNIALHNVEDITSNYYVADQHVVPQPRVWSEDLQSQIDVLGGKLRALERRVGASVIGLIGVRIDIESDELSGTGAQLNDSVTGERVAPLPACGPARDGVFEVLSRVEELRSRFLGIPDGTYRIKSNINGLYLARSQDGSGAVVMEQSDKSNISQRWAVFPVADGTYGIACHGSDSESLLSTANAKALVCVPSGGHTTWTIEPRGETYVIGNSGDATAIHLRKGPSPHVVSVSVRNNSQNQRWVLEHVAD